MDSNHSKDQSSGSENLPPTFNNLTSQSNPEQASTSSHENVSFAASVIQPQQTFLQNNFIHPKAFFYQPPDDLRNYHINCEEISLSMAIQLLNDLHTFENNFNQNEYRFYYQQQSNNRIYRVSCKVVCPLSLNKTVYNFEIEQNFGLEPFAFTFEQKDNLKFHLTQYLSRFLLN